MTDLHGLLLLKPRRIIDDRGYFEESWNRRTLSSAGIAIDFVQDNHVYSAKCGTLRGLHAQSPPHAQAKLVRCTRGAILDVAVDVRAASPSFGRWFSVELSAEDGLQLFVPAGFLHGYQTLVADTEVSYKCSAHYAPGAEVSVHWNSLGIVWPGMTEPLTSERDASAQPFSAFRSPFVAGEPW